MSIDRARRITFEETADIYNETRPSYPEALVEDVLAFSGTPVGGCILEIGCGPGNATIPFACRGYEILAVELGPRLAAYAAENCREYPQVKVVNMAFEDWPVEQSKFDLAISADAFHWIVPEIGYPKVAQALKPKGSLAFFWNAPSEMDTEISRAMAQVYLERAPQAENPEKRFTSEWMIQTVNETISSSHCFGEITVRLYDFSETQTGEQYVKSLWTYSSHRPLNNQTRVHLYEGLKEVIERFGGIIILPRRVVLFLAGKKMEI
jgi:SAM-dependent methyltransferase